MKFYSFQTNLKQPYISFSIIIGLILVTCISFTLNVDAQEILVQTGFEEFNIGEPPTDWDVRGNMIHVSDDTVRTGNNALGILGGNNDDRVGVAIVTENPVISVEFWVYIKGEGRSFNLKVVSHENIATNDGGVYMNWNENALRLYNGSAWVPIADFPFGTWKYVRVVADVGNSTYDYYVGDDRDAALTADPITDLEFRKAATNPVAQWVAFHVYSSVAAGFVDDLLIYEGSEPPNLAPVDPKDKLATSWGNIKNNPSF